MKFSLTEAQGGYLLAWWPDDPAAVATAYTMHVPVHTVHPTSIQGVKEICQLVGQAVLERVERGERPQQAATSELQAAWPAIDRVTSHQPPLEGQMTFPVPDDTPPQQTGLGEDDLPRGGFGMGHAPDPRSMPPLRQRDAVGDSGGNSDSLATRTDAYAQVAINAVRKGLT